MRGASPPGRVARQQAHPFIPAHEVQLAVFDGDDIERLGARDTLDEPNTCGAVRARLVR